MLRGALMSVTANFEDLYRVEWGRLVGTLRLVCGDAHLAEELAQEAFVRTWGAWDRVGVLDRPSGWVFTTGFNLVRHDRRDARRHRRRLGVLSSSLVAIDSDTTGTVDDRAALEHALATLPLRWRKAVVARYVLGWDTDTTAELLGVTPGALRALLHRAVERLRAAPLRIEEDA